MSNTQDVFEDLVDVVAQLRDPQNGCPWDLEQTHVSLAKYLEEETAETLEVLKTFENDQPNYEELKEELGDVLLQVLLHAQLAKETGNFNIDEILLGLKDKLIRRHPHVFGDSDAKTVEEVAKQWEEIKKEEKRVKNK